MASIIFLYPMRTLSPLAVNSHPKAKALQFNFTKADALIPKASCRSRLGLRGWVLELRLYRDIWEFPKIRGTILGVPIIRALVFCGLYWVLFILGNYHMFSCSIFAQTPFSLFPSLHFTEAQITSACSTSFFFSW